MPKKVYNNVESYKMFDGADTVEDVTSVSLPTIEHPTTEIKAAGMAGDIDMPNLLHINSMSYSIAHNNGLNSHLLPLPRRHEQELRIARQVYDVNGAEIGYESVKCRFVGVHVKTEKGSVESGNPMGSTEDYSCLRYEEEVNGTVRMLVDIMANKIVFNGVDYTNDINQFLE